MGRLSVLLLEEDVGVGLKWKTDVNYDVNGVELQWCVGSVGWRRCGIAV